MNKPTREEIDDWLRSGFSEHHYTESRILEWVDRFDSPCEIWSRCDRFHRLMLINKFPDKFSGLGWDDNLNNQEFQIKKYMEW